MEIPPGSPSDGFGASRCEVGHSGLTEEVEAIEAEACEGRPVPARASAVLATFV